MKSYKTLLFALAAIVMQFAVACNNDDPQPTPQPEPPTPEQPQPLTESHTLVIFMQGNNGLAEFMDSNLQRILAAYYDIPEGDFRILVFYDRGNYTRLTELYMNDGMAKQRLIEEYDTSTSTVDKAFIESEVRYNRLSRTNPERADALFTKAAKDAADKYAKLAKMAE